MKMSVNDWRLELFRQRQKQTKTDKDKDRNRQIHRQTKSKTKTKAKTGQKQTNNARTKTNIQLQKPTPKMSSHYTDGFYSSFGDILTPTSLIPITLEHQFPIFFHHTPETPH